MPKHVMFIKGREPFVMEFSSHANVPDYYTTFSDESGREVCVLANAVLEGFALIDVCTQWFTKGGELGPTNKS